MLANPLIYVSNILPTNVQRSEMPTHNYSSLYLLLFVFLYMFVLPNVVDEDILL